MTEAKPIGRNEPCPCGSGRKYKRCCGVSAAPVLNTPKNADPAAPAMDPSFMENMDPQWMMQVAQALQRLPRGQVQRLQSLMQKAMSGKDVSKEAQEFEKTLPVEFQSLIRSFQPPTAGGAPAEIPSMAIADTSAMDDEPSSDSSMSVDEARSLVEKAVQEGTLSAEQAETLLAPQENSSEASSKLGRWWRSFSGKKNN